MAKLAPSAIGFTGSIGKLSAYTARGHEGVIIRTKGGPTKKQIKKSPAFDLTRRNNSEFGGRATTSKWVMHALFPHKRLADHNIAGPLQKILKPIQALDSINEKGER